MVIRNEIQQSTNFFYASVFCMKIFFVTVEAQLRLGRQVLFLLRFKHE